MSHCILDSSAALAWVLPGEARPAIEELLDRVAVSGATVPALWPFEIANVLLIARRRSRITLAERHRAFALLAELPIQIEATATAHAWTETLALADTFELTVYDASNLEAALRLRLPLASLDADLRRAAERCGVVATG